MVTDIEEIELPCIVFFQHLSFIRSYTKAPTVVLTAKHFNQWWKCCRKSAMESLAG